MKRVAAALAAIALLAACGGTAAPATSQPTTAPAPGGPTAAPGGPTAAPGGAPTTAPVGGSLESKARALVPPGSTEVSQIATATSYQLIFSTTMSLDSLKQFWAQQIPAQGMAQSGSFEMQGVLTIALTNPDGGIVAVPDEEGKFIVTVSLGIRS